MNDLLERVEKSICQRGLLRRAQPVLVAVSGGVDSLVLLHVLHELSRQHGWRLSVAHLNHRLRGRSSDADERLVVRIAKQLGLRAIVERGDVKKFARAQKISLEMAARIVRHEFLARTASRLKIRTVALAHHADDQLELFFLRLLRGSGSEGLAGMKWKNPSPANSRIQLARPLLDASKAELREFAAENKIPFREDASNESLDIQRNRIRRELLPLLRRDYQPALDRTIARVMDIVGSESEFVTQCAGGWLKGRSDLRPLCPDFRFLSVAIQRRCIQLQLQRQKVAATFDLVESLRLRMGEMIQVSPELAVIIEADGHVEVRAAGSFAAPGPVSCEVTLNGRADALRFSGADFQWRVTRKHFRKVPAWREGREWFDADKVGSRIVLRHWRAGDRFQPSGMKSPVKLQDLFMNLKVPRHERHALVVAETADGEIFWVERMRIAERFKLSTETNRGLQWRWKRH